MKWLPKRPTAPAVSTLASRERVLAWANAEDGVVLVGTRDALHWTRSGQDEARRIPWQQVQAATWDLESSVFRVIEVGDRDVVRAEHAFVLDEARLLLELVRERVTASIVIQRRFQVPGGGLLVIARRAPHGHDAVTWVFEYDESVNPQDPGVQAAAQRALELAKGDLGLE